MSEIPAQPSNAEVLAKADDLGEKMDKLAGAYTTMSTRLRRLKVITYGLAVVAVFSIAGLVVSLVVATSAHHASDKATAALSKANLTQQTQVTTCLAGNESRAISKQLWLYVLDLSAALPRQPGQTVEQYRQGQKILKTLRAKVIGTYKPRDCSPAALQHSPAPH